MRRIEFGHDYETIDEMRAAGRHNLARVATYRANRRTYRVTLGAGNSDTVLAYREGDSVYFVTIRRSLGYCGIAEFIDGEAAGDLFLQSEDDVTDTLGRDALDRLVDATIARRLADALRELG